MKNLIFATKKKLILDTRIDVLLNYLYTQVFAVTPTLSMVEIRKSRGDTLEFHKFYKNFSVGLKDVVWPTREETTAAEETAAAIKIDKKRH